MQDFFAVLLKKEFLYFIIQICHSQKKFVDRRFLSVVENAKLRCHFFGKQLIKTFVGSKEEHGNELPSARVFRLDRNVRSGGRQSERARLLGRIPTHALSTS